MGQGVEDFTYMRLAVPPVRSLFVKERSRWTWPEGKCLGTTEKCPHSYPFLCQEGANKQGEHNPVLRGSLSGRINKSSNGLHNQTMISHEVLLTSCYQNRNQGMGGAGSRREALILGRAKCQR